MIKKTKYSYFVSFAGVKNGYAFVKDCKVLKKNKIKTYGDVQTTALQICREYDLDGMPSIINYKLLGKECAK